MENKRRIKNPSVSKSTDGVKSRLPMESDPDVPPPQNWSSDIDSRKNPRQSMVSAGALLKPSYMNRATTTISTSESSPATDVSSSSSQEGPRPEEPPDDLQQFHQSLYRTFSAAGKPVPLFRQSSDAFDAVSDAPGAFLAWLPGSKAFARTETAGGLRMLVEFWRSERKGNPHAAAPALSPPCDQCRPFSGWLMIEFRPSRGVFGEELYSQMRPCSCARGKEIQAGIDRNKREQPSPPEPGLNLEVGE